MKLRHRIVTVALALFAALIVGGCSAESKRRSQLERAAAYRKSGDLERARIEYQNVLQKFPEDITALEELALIWRDRGALMREFAYLAKLGPLAPGNLEARVRRAQLLVALGSPAEARREALAAVQRSASAAEALVVLAETARDPAERKETEEFLKAFPEKANVWHNLATSRLAWQRGDREAARQAVARAVSIDPKSPAAHAAMGELQGLLGNAEQAAAEFKLVAELAPARSRFRLQYVNHLVQTGRVPAATEALNAILKEAPDNQAALRALAHVAMTDKRPADALGLLDKVFALDVADYEALILRARIWHAQGDAAKAVAEFQRIGTQFPGLGLELPHLAIAQLQLNDTAAATATLEQAAARFPENHEVAILLAQVHQRAGQHDRVVAAMARLLGRRADLVQPYLLMIEAAKASGKLEALAELFRKNIASNPTVPLLHHMLGLTLRQQAKPADARTSFEKAAELSPQFAPALTELAGLDVAEGRFDAALQRAQQLTERLPKNPVGPLLAAQVNLAAKRWSAAEAAASQALQLDRNQNAAYAVIAESFAARRGETGIVAAIEAFLAKFPTESAAQSVAAQSFVVAGAHARGREVYEKILAATPNAVPALNNLANLHAEQLGQLDRALELARKARTIAPTDPAVADTLGWILYRRKEFAEAATVLEEAAKGLPALGEIQYHLGMTQRALGKNDAALAALRAAVAAPGDFTGKEDAKRALAELDKAK